MINSRNGNGGWGHALGPKDLRWEARLGRIPRALAGIVFLLACTVFLFWVLDLRFPPVSPQERSNAPVGFMLAAVVLWIQGNPQGILSSRDLFVSRLVSICVCLLGGLTLLEYVLHWDLGIDPLILNELLPTDPLPGRMSPNASFGFFFLGLGSLLFSVSSWGRKFAMILYSPVVAISFLGFIGYLQGATFLYHHRPYPPMTWLTALGFLGMVSGHFLCRSPFRPTPTIASAGLAGMVIRRLVLTSLLFPILLSWGTGLAVRRDIVDPELGLALFVSALVWTLTWYAFKTACLLDTSELRYRVLFERSAVGIAELDVGTKKFISANRKFQQITGFSLEELRELSPFDLTHPEDLMTDHQNFMRLLKGGTASYRSEKRYIRKDGATIWLRVDAAIGTRDEYGQPLTTVGAAVDITEEKEVSLALERSEKALRIAVQARDQFTSIASHELKTPLTNLLLRSQLAKQGVFSDSLANYADGLQDFLEHVEAQALRLNELVDEMLDVARVRSGKLILARGWFDLNDAVAAVVARLKPLLLKAAGGSPPIIELCEPAFGKWDRARIEQVLTNLLSNVMRYGAGAAAQIRVESREDAVRLTVQDRGIGIAPEDLENIFGRFVSGSTSARQGGLGLGLYLTRKILEAHGGSICADSELGVGTTFIVDLPLKQKGVDSIEVA